MGIQKLYSDDYEKKKNDEKKEFEKIDKKSIKTADLIKRIEAIEKILGLD